MTELRDTNFAEQNYLFRRHCDSVSEPTTFRLFDKEWDLLPGVFSPALTPASGYFTEWLEYPVDGTFCEIGPGTGVTSVVAALTGGTAVTAIDVAPAAVRNTELNVARYGVSDRVEVLLGDMFAGVDPGRRFDLIFWNSNFVRPPDGFVNTTDLHHALFDPGYAAHADFLNSVPARLTDGGRAMLGFSNLGDRVLLDNLAADAGVRLSAVRSAEHSAGPVTVVYELLEVGLA